MKLDSNKSIKSAVEILEQFQLDPLAELSRLTVEAKQRDDDVAVESICKFLMPYVYAKHKQVSMDIGLTPINQELVERLRRGRERVSNAKNLTHANTEISFL